MQGFIDSDGNIIEQIAISDWQEVMEEENKPITQFDDKLAELVGTIFRDDFARLKPAIAKKISFYFQDEQSLISAYDAWLTGEEKGTFYKFIKTSFGIDDEDCYHHMKCRKEAINKLKTSQKKLENAQESCSSAEERYDKASDHGHASTSELDSLLDDYNTAYENKKKCQGEKVLAENAYQESLFSVQEINSNFGL